jgi:hypothetical protein
LKENHFTKLFEKSTDENKEFSNEQRYGQEIKKLLTMQ